MYGEAPIQVILSLTYKKGRERIVSSTAYHELPMDMQRDVLAKRAYNEPYGSRHIVSKYLGVRSFCKSAGGGAFQTVQVLATNMAVIVLYDRIHLKS